jgi:hypothetical protein
MGKDSHGDQAVRQAQFFHNTRNSLDLRGRPPRGEWRMTTTAAKGAGSSDKDNGPNHRPRFQGQLSHPSDRDTGVTVLPGCLKQRTVRILREEVGNTGL